MYKGSLLVIGLDTTALTASAKQAGYIVYAVDFFGDRDLKAIARRSLSLIQQTPGKSCGRVSTHFSPDALVKLARQLARECSFDGILLSSGLEDAPEALEALRDIAPIIGNSPNVIAKVRNRIHLYESLERLGIRCPKTRAATSLSEAEKAAEEIGYPVIVKPLRGFGGAKVRLVEDGKKLADNICDREKILVQRYIRGVAASVSFIAACEKAQVLTANEQLLGLPNLGAPEPFTYCGNIVPLSVPDGFLKQCRESSNTLAKAFGLVGSNGIDLVIDDVGQSWVIEVNPRFQGTLECVERVLGINLVDVHIASCQEHILAIPTTPTRFSVRLILYARYLCRTPNLTVFPEVRDIPSEGVFIEEGEPLCSVIADGRRREEAFRRASYISESIYGSIPI